MPEAASTLAQTIRDTEKGQIEMEVKPGYKQTEVGVIPEDWDVSTMLGLSRQIMDFRGRTPKKLGMEWGGGDIPALSAANVKKGFIDFAEECNSGSEALYRKWMTRGDVAKDDILFTTEAPLGNVALVPDERKYILSQRTILLQIDPQRALSRFLFQLMLADGFQRVLADYSSGSTAKGIQRKKFEQLCVARPPLSEQRAIAEALSDVDGLLGGLDRLIAKKRDLKQAAMQQLLTGQTRLPGFHGEWKPWTVLQVAPHIIDYRGRTPLKLGMEWGGGDIPALSARNVKMGYIDFHEETNFGSDALYRRWMTNGHTRKDDLVVTTEAPLGNVALIPDDGKYILSQRTILLQVEPTIASNRFLIQLMMGSRFQQALAENSSGSTATGIQRKRFEKLELTLPEVPEQTAIAEVLTEMDLELAGLEQRREKTRALKQAMMQELLTGRTRLV